MPLQAHWVDAQVAAQAAHLADLRLEQEVARVDEGKAARLARGLTGCADGDG